MPGDDDERQADLGLDHVVGAAAARFGDRFGGSAYEDQARRLSVFVEGIDEVEREQFLGSLQPASLRGRVTLHRARFGHAELRRVQRQVSDLLRGRGLGWSSSHDQVGGQVEVRFRGHDDLRQEILAAVPEGSVLLLDDEPAVMLLEHVPDPPRT